MDEERDGMVGFAEFGCMDMLVVCICRSYGYVDCMDMLTVWICRLYGYCLLYMVIPVLGVCIHTDHTRYTYYLQSNMQNP